MIEETKRILKNLAHDLDFDGKYAKRLIWYAKCAIADGNDLLRDHYYTRHSKIRVMNTYYLGKSDGDMTGEMIDISMGYQKFFEKQMAKAEKVLSDYKQAVDVLLLILEMPSPYSDILYMRYVKQMTCFEVAGFLYIARTTFFRQQETAIRLLDEKLEGGEERKEFVIQK